MGNTYLIYTEAKIDGEWRCIDGYHKHKPYGKSEEVWMLYATLENGSRSYFGDTYEKLAEIGSDTAFSKLSKEIRDEHPDFAKKYTLFGDESDEEAYYTTVPIKDFNSAVPKGYTHHGVIHKDVLEDFRTGEIDEMWQDDQIDFNKLSDLEKQLYEYCEWDNSYEWQYWFKKLKKYTDETVRKFMNNEWAFEDPEVRIVVFCL